MKKEELAIKYDEWNTKKKNIQLYENTDRMYFKEGQVWWCSLGLNIGSESFGKGEHFRRPILIIKKLSADLFIALPLTTKEKIGTWFIDVQLQGEKRWVMLYQIRTLNKKRLYLKIDELDDADFIRVKEKLETLLELGTKRHPAEAGIEGTNPKSNITIADKST